MCSYLKVMNVYSPCEIVINESSYFFYIFLCVTVWGQSEIFSIKLNKLTAIQIINRIFSNNWVLYDALLIKS